MNVLSVTDGAEGCPDGLEWYALHVFSNCERMVQSALRRRGIEDYLPMYTERVRWSDRHKIVERPLFPGYLFARFRSNDHSIMRLPSVVQVLGADPMHPTPVPRREIDTVRQLIASGYPVSPWEDAVPGDRVVIEHGPFTGVEGKLVQIKGESRLVVSLPMLNRNVSVTLDAEYVRRVK